MAAHRRGSVKVLVQPLKHSLLAIATELFSSLSVRTWMRELNARTDIGGSRWSIPGLRDLLTVQTARLLGHPAWTDLHRSTHRPNTITSRLQKFNAA